MGLRSGHFLFEGGLLVFEGVHFVSDRGSLLFEIVHFDSHEGNQVFDVLQFAFYSLGAEEIVMADVAIAVDLREQRTASCESRDGADGAGGVIKMQV